MLNTYTDVLNNLSASDTDDLAERVALRLRFSAKPHEVERCTQSARDLILSLPNFTSKIHEWLKHPSLSAGIKPLLFDLTGLLHHPMDVVPHRATLFAYLEDAFMAGHVLKSLLEIAEADEFPASEEVSQWKDRLPVWLADTKMVIPWESRKTERIVDEIFERRGRDLKSSAQKSVSSQERLTSAVNALKGGQTFDPPFSEQYVAA